MFSRNFGLSEKEVTRSICLAAVASSVDHMFFALPCARLQTEAIAIIHLVMAFADIKLLSIKPCRSTIHEPNGCQSAVNESSCMSGSTCSGDLGFTVFALRFWQMAKGAGKFPGRGLCRIYRPEYGKFPMCLKRNSLSIVSP